PRFLASRGTGEITVDEGELPTPVQHELQAIHAGITRPVIEPTGWIRVPMTLEGRTVGALVAQHNLEVDPEPGDLSVLRILANQAAVSLHTSDRYQAGLALHRKAQRLYDEATAQARNLADRTAELRQVEERLLLAHQRELIDGERHRLARELHDSVTQYVLSAGMAVELARGEAEDLGSSGAQILDRLTTAKKLSQDAVEQLRRAIYALHQPHRDTVSTLPELLHEVARQHKPHLAVVLRVEGDVIKLPDNADHELARTVGEALFNVATHARATRAIVRLRYRRDRITLSVADDGCGDPTELSRKLRLERATMVDGRHRGLVNMDSRVGDLGGSLGFRRARLGGVRVEIRLPLPLHPPPLPGAVDDLAGAPGKDREARERQA
ncbi:MAG: histidine kinase, partial [Nocardioidaceae bacterium]